MSLKMKIHIVNKYEYQENEDYREIVIKIPKESQKLEEDFEYLGLDYNNLSIQDTHILDCEVIDADDPQFSSSISLEISNIIARASDTGWTTPFQDIKNMFAIIKSLGNEERDKLLAVLELKKEQISNMRDAVKYGNNLDCFEFYNNIHYSESYAEKLIEDEEVGFEDIIDYVDLERMGNDYIQSNAGKFTEQGLIFENDSLSRRIELKSYENNENEDVEEFE